MTNSPRLERRGVRRSFGATKALRGLQFLHGLRGVRWRRQAEWLLPRLERLAADAEFRGHGICGLAAALPQLHGGAFEVQIVTGLPLLNGV